MKRLLTLMAGFALAVTGALGAEDPPADHVQWMKDLGGQMGAIRKGADVEKNAKDMQATLKQVGAFWKKRNSEVASKSCGESYKGAAAVAKAAAASDKEGVAAGMKMIGAGCKGCHDAHREKISDTVYKIK
ncbi:MAG: cytochrome c [Bryobacterales bacterium]|nr:cytochrome c [Bryobacterales bacterium]